MRERAVNELLFIQIIKKLLGLQKHYLYLKSQDMDKILTHNFVRPRFVSNTPCLFQFPHNMRPLLFLGISLLCLVVQQSQASPFLWSTWKALTCWSSSSSESDSAEEVLGSSNHDGHYSGFPLMELLSPWQEPQHQANPESQESATNEVRQSNHVRYNNPSRNPIFDTGEEYNHLTTEVSPSHYPQPQHVQVPDHDDSSPETDY